ncbi:MAG: hypothetical protein PSV36_19340 [Algoriphagus sp.]|nr:hypothetical protein [Algoriphagus sp.]
MNSFLRPLLIIFSVLFILSCSSSKNYLPYEGYGGKPNKLEFISFSSVPAGSSIEPNLMSKEVYEFDKKGRKVSIQIFRGNLSPVNGGTGYYYSKNGSLERSEFYDLDGKIQTTQFFQYNKKGQLIKTEFHKGNQITVKKTTFDPKNHLSYTTLTSPDGSLRENSVKQLDKKGRPLVMTDFTKEGAQKIKIEFQYDQSGNEIFSKWYNAEDELYEYYRRSFNSKNDEVLNEKFKVTDGDTLLVSTTIFEYTYDTLENQIERRIMEDGKVYLDRINVFYPSKEKN